MCSLKCKQFRKDDGWTDDVEIEAQAPAWLRIESRRNPFPVCRQLQLWPLNYPVGELADLDDSEHAVLNPDDFVYSDPEMEGWATVVRAQTILLEEPSWLPKRLVSGHGFYAVRDRLRLKDWTDEIENLEVFFGKPVTPGRGPFFDLDGRPGRKS